MARMARLLRAVPELMILIKGMIAAVRSVGFVALLSLLLMYVFAIVFRQLTDENEVLKDAYFNHIPGSIMTLFMAGTLMDNIAEVLRTMFHENPLCAIIFLIFVMISALTIMNMLIGVLCEVITAVAATEKEANTVDFVKERMQYILHALDLNMDGTISREEFVRMLDSHEAIATLQEVDVDVIGLVDLADYIFNDQATGKEHKLDFVDFMTVVLDLRGSNGATVKDVVDLRKFIRTQCEDTNEKLDELHRKMKKFPLALPSTSPPLRLSKTDNDGGILKLPFVTDSPIQLEKLRLSPRPVETERLLEWTRTLETDLSMRWAELQKLVDSLSKSSCNQLSSQLAKTDQHGSNFHRIDHIPESASCEAAAYDVPEMLTNLPGIVGQEVGQDVRTGFQNARPREVEELRDRMSKLQEGLTAKQSELKRVCTCLFPTSY